MSPWYPLYPSTFAAPIFTQRLIFSPCYLPDVLLAAAHPGPSSPSCLFCWAPSSQNNSSLKNLLVRNLKGINPVQHIKKGLLIRAFLVVLSNSLDGKDIRDLMLFWGSNKISQISYGSFKVQNGWFSAPALFLYLTKVKIKKDTKTRNINSRWNCVLQLLEVILYLLSV